MDLDGDREAVIRTLRGTDADAEPSPPGSPVIIASLVPAQRGPSLNVLSQQDTNVKRAGLHEHGGKDHGAKKVLVQLR